MLSLVEFVRLVSAVLGITGAVVIAPDASRTLWGEALWPPVRKAAASLGLYKSPAVASGSASVQLTGSGVAIAGAGQVTVRATDGTWQQELGLLRTQLEGLERRLAALDARLTGRVDDVSAKLEAAARELRDDLNRLNEDVVTIAQELKRFNSAGLPIIACAFTLAGVPEAWINRWWSAAIWLLIAGGVTGLALRRAARLRARSRRAAQ